MQYSLRKVILGLMLASLLGGSAWAQGRVATIDMRKVFDGYWKTKHAEAALKDRQADMEKEHKNMVDDWKKAKDDYQSLLSEANNQAISSDERDKRKKSAEDKLKYIKETEDSIAQYERQARTTLDEQRRRMVDNIVAEIRNIVNAKAKAAGFAMVIDTSAQTTSLTPVVLFSDNSNDITAPVLESLNVGAPPPETAKSDDKPPAKKDEKKKDEKKK
jgi:outer membrane protein